MKKIISTLFTFVLFLVTSLGFAQNENSLLWEISGNGLEKPSYVFGTIHMICEEDYFFTEQFGKALSNSEVLITEIDFTNMQEMMEMQQAIQSDISLKERLTNEQYKKLTSLLNEKLGLDIMMFDKVSESGIASMVTMKSFPCENFKMYEMELLQKAMAENKTFSGLESVKDQMKIMEDHLNIDASIKMLEELGTDVDSNKEMVALYKEQNIDELLGLLKESSYMNPKAYDEFVVNRNNNWVKKMPELMKNKSIFFAVGAAHLGSKDGVLDLLRAAGFKVEAINKN